MRSWLTYIAAYLCALSATYVVASIAASAVGRGSTDMGMFVSIVLVPTIIGIVLFGMIYGWVGTTPYGVKQWLGTVVFVSAVVGVTLLLAISRTVTEATGMGIGVLVLFVGGRYLIESRVRD